MEFISFAYVPKNTVMKREEKKMKKTVLSLIIFVLAFVTCCFFAIAAEAAVYELDPDSNEKFEFYRKVVESRINDTPYFSKEESRVLMEHKYEIRENWLTKYNGFLSVDSFYFPIVCKWDDVYWMMYTTKWGDVCHRGLNKSLDSGYSLGNLNLPEKTKLVADYTTIERTHSYSVVYSPSKAMVWVYKMGRIYRTFFVPEGSEYAGQSFWYGFIFRAGTDVYCLNLFGETGNAAEEGDTAECIAHGVKFVILADYKLSSDSWSQPLFLMEDGRLMAYTWSNDKDVPADDESHLKEVKHEGGYLG